MAHIGVLKVLEREGIRPSIIAGTSAGAVIGAAYAAGVPLSDMSEIFHKARWPKLIGLSFRNTLSIFDTKPLEEFIREKINDVTFETLPRKFAVVACDLISGKRVVLNKGPVAPAVCASAAFPLIFSPVKMGDQLLIDGGVVDNLPADLVREMGADYIIAVDLTNEINLKKHPGNFIEVVIAVINLMQARSAMPDPKNINCRIRPRVEDLSAWTFGDSVELEKRGVEAAEQMIAKLKYDLRI